MMTFVITAKTPQQTLQEVVRYLQTEAHTLEVRAGRSTGRDKKDLAAQASYARRLMRFWSEVEIGE